MKKLVFMFVAMFAMSFASCGGSNNTEAPAEAEEAVVEEAAAPVEEVAAPADSVAEAPADSAAVAE